MTHKQLPVRLSADGQTATWNPGLSRAPHVVLEVHGPGGVEHRRSMNSGRARVRAGERIVSVAAAEDPSAPADHPAENPLRDVP